MAKALFLQLYSTRLTIFVVSNGCFNRILARGGVSVRIATNKAQQTLTDYFTMIVFFSDSISGTRGGGAVSKIHSYSP